MFSYDYCEILRTPILKNICERLFLKIYPVLLFWLLEDISEVALLASYKIGVLRTSVKFLGKHICRSLFSIKFQTFTLKFYWVKDCVNEICKIVILRTPLLQYSSGRLLLIFRKLDIQAFNARQICWLD